jgi:Transcriptional regulator
MTQSGASQAIAQLEASLGFPVFTRERRYIGVTALGVQVVEHDTGFLVPVTLLPDSVQAFCGCIDDVATILRWGE